MSLGARSFVLEIEPHALRKQIRLLHFSVCQPYLPEKHITDERPLNFKKERLRSELHCFLKTFACGISSIYLCLIERIFEVIA